MSKIGGHCFVMLLVKSDFFTIYLFIYNALLPFQVLTAGTLWRLVPERKTILVFLACNMAI